MTKNNEKKPKRLKKKQKLNKPLVVYMILCRVIVAQTNDLNKKQQPQKNISDDLDSDDEEYLEEKYRQIF